MDPDAIENTLSKSADASEGPKNATHDDKTEELVTSLETSVDKAYTSIQDTTLSGINKIQGMVAGKLPELQKQWNDVKLPQIANVEGITKNLKLEEYVKKEDLESLKQRGGELISKAGENTNKVLDDLDQDLEKLEKLTIDYAQQIGGQIGSFFKSQLAAADAAAGDEKASEKEAPAAASTSGGWNWSSWGKQLNSLIAGESPEAVLASEKKSELLFNLPKGINPGTRAESQVHELQSDASIYLKAFETGEFKDYKLDDEQKAESAELMNSPSLHLMAIYSTIVKSTAEEAEEATKEESSETPADGSKAEKQLGDDDFWKIYFGKREQIINDEQKRRELLDKSKDADEQEEDDDFNWDE